MKIIYKTKNLKIKQYKGGGITVMRKSLLGWYEDFNLISGAVPDSGIIWLIKELLERK